MSVYAYSMCVLLFVLSQSQQGISPLQPSVYGLLVSVKTEPSPFQLCFSSHPFLYVILI